MISYNNDPIIRFDHTPVVNKIAFQVNQIGPDDPYVFPAVDYTDTDDNTIYVNSESPGDDANPGTYASPKATLLAAINATTATKTKVVVQDSATIFNEDISGGTYTYLQGIYQETTGGSSSWVGRQLGFTPSDSNAIWVSKDGADDTSADGTQANPYLSINYAKDFCDTGKDIVVINDSGTYEEEGFEFTGNFTGIYAAVGKAPILSMLQNNSYFELAADVSETLFHNAQTGEASCCELNNGKIIITYRDISDSHKGKYIVLNSTDYSVSVAETVFHDAATYNTSVCQLLNGGIIITYVDNADGDKGKYIVLSNADYSVLKSETEFHGAATFYTNVYQLASGLIFISYRDNVGGQGKYVVLNTDYSVSKTETIFFSGALNGVAVSQLSNGNILIIYGDGTASDGKYLILDTSYNEVVSATQIHNVLINYPSVKINEAGQIFIAFRQEDVNSRGKYVVLDSDFTEIVGATIFHDALTDGTCLEYMDNDKILFIYTDTSDTNKGKYLVLSPENKYMFLNSIDSIISGLKIYPKDTYYIKTLINCISSEIDIKWCEIYNAESSTENVNCTAISSDSHVDITYSKIHDCDIGVITTEDTSNFSDSQFYRINKGYAIDVDGAAGTGAGINIEHCDFFDCYGGVHLENNDGGEVIKNCIFHDISVYAIDAEIALTVTYCVVTSSVTTTVTLGSYTNRGNPDYVNEGYTDPDDTDLNLRVKVLGYPGNSAAYALADDSRNAGSIDVKYIGTETTYTSITVPKPNKIDVTYQHAGATNTQRKDGSWSSGKDGQSEIITMTWDGIAATYMAQLLTMWKTDEMDVLIYPDPVTYPTSFEQWTILREPMGGGVASPTLSDLGAQGVQLKFAKAVS